MIEIQGTPIGPGQRPYIIAEVGINARNDLTLAKRFIEVAADAGADAVKFQSHIADAEMVEAEMRAIGAGEVYETVAGCEWTLDEHYELQSHADTHDVTFLSTPFSTEAVEILDEIDVPAIKIGSGEMNNRHLLDHAASTGKPLLVSTGMNTINEIEETTKFLDEAASEYALLYCVSAYPTTAADFDFKTIGMLEEIADVPVGFSDHSTGVEAAKVAISHGSALVEKHFTIDRRLPGPDQEVSIEPGELENLCDFATLYDETYTNKDGLINEEVGVKQWAHHSIVSTQTIFKGEQITSQMISTKRPNTGIPANRYFEVLGKVATREIPENTVLQEKHCQ